MGRLLDRLDPVDHDGSGEGSSWGDGLRLPSWYGYDSRRSATSESSSNRNSCRHDADTTGIRQGPFDKIESGLLHGKQIIAVYDAIGAGTDFLGVTNVRVVLQDNSFVARKWR